MVFGSLPIAEMRAEGPKLSVVIPCLNEAARLPLLLADLQRWPLPIAITVVDGGSSDASHEAVEEATDRKNTEISGDRANSVDQEFDNKERKLFVTPKEDKPAKISGRPDGKMNILFMVSSLENYLLRLSLWH